MRQGFEGLSLLCRLMTSMCAVFTISLLLAEILTPSAYSSTVASDFGAVMTVAEVAYFLEKLDGETIVIRGNLFYSLEEPGKYALFAVPVDPFERGKSKGIPVIPIDLAGEHVLASDPELMLLRWITVEGVVKAVAGKYRLVIHKQHVARTEP